MTWKPEIEELRRREELARRMGGPEKIERQHSNDRLTVRERIDELLDEGTFDEIGAIAGKGEYDEDGELVDFTPANFVMGVGRIHGRKVALGGDDFTVRGGASDAAIAGKQVLSEQIANGLRIPLVRLVEGTGGGGSVKVLEDKPTYVPANPAWDLVVDNMSKIPVVAAGLGPVAGLGAARLAASHLSLLVEDSAQLFVAGPPVVKFGLGEDVDKEQLGGATAHRRSGAVDIVVDSEQEAFATIRRFLSYLPQSAWEIPPVVDNDDPVDRADEWLLDAVPRSRRQTYKIRRILESVFDDGSVLEIHRYGGPTVCALARLDGHPVGVITQDTMRSGGSMTVEGADALIRMVDLCETFNLPIVALTDQPGVMIGTAAERRGTIRHGVRAVASVYQATVPVAEVIIRRVFGVGGAGMTNRHAFARRWAWPSGDWGSLPVEGGIEAAYRRDLEASDDPQALRSEILEKLDRLRNPFRTAEIFGVEQIIDPRETRERLCDWVDDAYRLLPDHVGPPSHGTRP